jgi:hypothetical protein
MGDGNLQDCRLHPLYPIIIIKSARERWDAWMMVAQVQEHLQTYCWQAMVCCNGAGAAAEAPESAYVWIFACCVPGLVLPALGYVAQTLTGLAVPLLWGIVACRVHLDGVRRPWHAPACVEGAAIKLCGDVTKQESAWQAYPGVCAMVAKLWGCSESRLERTCGIWHCHGSIEQTACALA